MFTNLSIVTHVAQCKEPVALPFLRLSSLHLFLSLPSLSHPSLRTLSTPRLLSPSLPPPSVPSSSIRSNLSGSWKAGQPPRNQGPANHLWPQQPLPTEEGDDIQQNDSRLHLHSGVHQTGPAGGGGEEVGCKWSGVPRWVVCVCGAVGVWVYVGGGVHVSLCV